MASLFNLRSLLRPSIHLPQARSLSRHMTVHVSAAVCVFAAVQLWAVVAAIDMGAPRSLTLAALVVLLVIVLPIARKMERHWYSLGRSALPSVGLRQRFRRDVARLWIAAILLPATWVGLTVISARAAAATF